MSQRAQAQLAAAAGATVAAGARHVHHPDFPLRRFVRCGTCAGPMTASWSKGRSARYGFYHCRKGCVRVRRERLEDAFIALLDRLRPETAFLRTLRRFTLDKWDSVRQGQREERLALERQIAAIENRLSHLDRMFLFEQRIDDETYRTQRDEQRRLLAVSRVTLRQKSDAQTDIEGLLAFAEHAMGNASALWTSASSTEMRLRVQTTFFPDGLTWSNRGAEGAGKFVEPRSCLEVFNLRTGVEENGGMASPTGPTWNQVLSWLQHMQGAKAA